jgi:hypothetical protein
MRRQPLGQTYVPVPERGGGGLSDNLNFKELEMRYSKRPDDKKRMRNRERLKKRVMKEAVRQKPPMVQSEYASDEEFVKLAIEINDDLVALIPRLLAQQSDELLNRVCGAIRSAHQLPSDFAVDDKWAAERLYIEQEYLGGLEARMDGTRAYYVRQFEGVRSAINDFWYPRLGEIRNARLAVEGRRQTWLRKCEAASRNRKSGDAEPVVKPTWTFKDLDKTELNLEALRYHISREALEEAVRTYIRYGGRVLKGVDIFPEGELVSTKQVGREDRR